MKHLCLLITANLLAASALFTQNTPFEATIRNSFFSYGEYIFPMDNGESIIVGKDYMSGGFGSQALRMDIIDATGNVLLSNSNTGLNLVAYERYFINGAASAIDNSFFITGNQSLCDVGLYPDIMRFDANGNHIWTLLVSNLSGSFSGPLKTANNEGVWGTGNGELIHLATNGTILQTVPIPFNAIGDFDYSLTTGDFIVFGYDGQGQLLYITDAGATYQTVTEGLTQVKVKLLDNGMVIIFDESTLKLYDNQLNLTDSLLLSGLSANEHTRLTCDNQYIYLARGDWGEPYSLARVDYNLQNLIELPAPFKIKDIGTRDGHVQIMGHEHTHVSLKNISNDFDNAFADRDISLVNILVNAADSTCAEFFFYCNCNFEAEGVRAVVQNLGTEVINSYEINYLHNCLNDCYDPQEFLMTYEDRNLLPGQLDTVSFPDLSLLGYEDTRLCLYTSRPNGLTDKNLDNDEICRDFFLNDIVNVENTERDLSPVIFPNPTTGIFNIKGIAEGEYSIFNTAGQILQTGQLEHDISMDISAFPQGVYFISVMVNDEQVVRRLVKI